MRLQNTGRIKSLELDTWQDYTKDRSTTETFSLSANPSSIHAPYAVGLFTLIPYLLRKKGCLQWGAADCRTRHFAQGSVFPPRSRFLRCSRGLFHRAVGRGEDREFSQWQREVEGTKRCCHCSQQVYHKWLSFLRRKRGQPSKAFWRIGDIPLKSNWRKVWCMALFSRETDGNRLGSQERWPMHQVQTVPQTHL